MHIIQSHTIDAANIVSQSKGVRSTKHRRNRLSGFEAGVLVLMASTALYAAPAFAGDALPTGGSVAAGNVAISSSGGAMTVRQGSDKAIVNWQGFSIAHGNSVDFVQPDVHSAILNRVTGSTPSSIAGSLSANGQVFLVNPNGIAITKTGTVKAAGGFAASTLDISDDDFMKGQLNFRGNGSSATISNEGVISIGRGGYAALMGGKVKNDGLVAVPYGKAGFGAGEAITLDLSGDGFMQVAVPSALADDDEALIDNSGTVSADGGVIVMKAATAQCGPQCHQHVGRCRGTLGFRPQWQDHPWRRSWRQGPGVRQGFHKGEEDPDRRAAQGRRNRDHRTSGRA